MLGHVDRDDLARPREHQHPRGEPDGVDLVPSQAIERVLATLDGEPGVADPERRHDAVREDQAEDEAERAPAEEVEGVGVRPHSAKELPEDACAHGGSAQAEEDPAQDGE